MLTATCPAAMNGHQPSPVSPGEPPPEWFGGLLATFAPHVVSSWCVGEEGLEPTTSSVSQKRATSCATRHRYRVIPEGLEPTTCGV